MEIALTENQIKRLKHTIGWNYDNQPRKYGRSKPILNAYRNHYYGEDEACEQLCELQIMHKRHITSSHNNSSYYYVSPFGFQLLENFFDIKIKYEDD